MKFTLNKPNARKNRPLPVKTLLIAVSFWLFACSNHAELDGPAPAIVFNTLSGDAIELRSVEKPMLVNFWSTSCGICLSEMPELAALYNEYKEKGVEMVMVAGPHDRPNEVLEMAEAKAWPFPVALDIDGKVDAAFGTIIGTPTRFLINADGQLVARMVGKVELPKLKKELDKLI
ncbi:MAG: TlpA disulfide reductase family protein [Granulosicoccaceae bacterium]